MSASTSTGSFLARGLSTTASRRAVHLAFTVAIVAGALSPRAGARTPPVGAISAVEGRVTLDGELLAADVSHAPRVGAGHVLATGNGRAELLLNPGIFLRLAENSAVQLVVSSPDRTRLDLLRGEALLEVLQIGNEEVLEIVDQEAHTRLLQEGLYVFRAEGPSIAVYQGKARVERIGDKRTRVSVGRTRALQLSAAGLRPGKIDVTHPDALYQWSARRTRTVAQTSESMAENLLAFAPGSSYDAGWYWNRWLQAWAFIPEDGYRLSAFGYGFYAPTAVHSILPVFADYRQ